jgi:predicted dehydrogenase
VRKLRVAVVGAGRLGAFHARKLAAMEQVELVAVVDPLPERRNRLAAECHTRPWADHRPLLAQLDAAVIAAPTRFHHSLGLEFLESGVHLLVEKPLAAALAEADELVAAARRAGLVLQVGHIERFNPALAAALPYVRNPKYVEAVRAGGFTFRSTDIGVVLDLMIHDLDVLLWLVRSPVRKVEALGLSVLGGHEDVANARLHFQCGCVATLSASRVSHQPVRRMQVWAPRAMADIDFGAVTATIVRPSETLLARRFDVDSLSPEEVEHYQQHLFNEHLPRQELHAEAVDALALELDDFVQSIRTARPPRVTGEQGREAVAVAEQILAKIHSHAWDDTADGPVGPLATPRPSVVPTPHWHLAPAHFPIQQKEAG